MTKGLLDTNVVIHGRALDVEQLPESNWICSITLAEISVGPHVATGRAELALRLQAARVAKSFNPIPFDNHSATIYGRLYKAMLDYGRQPRGRIADLMIASVAVSREIPLYTMNPKDFVGLEDYLEFVPVDRPSLN